MLIIYIYFIIIFKCDSVNLQSYIGEIYLLIAKPTDNTVLYKAPRRTEREQLFIVSITTRR